VKNVFAHLKLFRAGADRIGFSPIKSGANQGKIFEYGLMFIVLTGVKCILDSLVFMRAIQKTTISFPLVALMVVILISGFWRSFFRYTKNKLNIVTLLLDLVLTVSFSLLSKSGHFDKLFMIYLVEGTAILPKPFFIVYGILATTASVGAITLYNFREYRLLQLPGLTELLLYGFVFALVLSERRQREQRWVYEKLSKELSYANLQLKESMALNESLASEAERRQLVSEIHDSLGYHLTGLLLTLEAGEKLMSRDVGIAKTYWEKAIELSRVAIHSVRELVSVKKESNFEFELTSRLKEMVREVKSITGLRIDLDINTQDMGLPGKAQFAMYRIFQEAITNTLRHANADQARIVISGNEEGFDFSYEDNGSGINRIEAGNGLKGMNDRISEIGGTLYFQSQIDMGFKIEGRINSRRKK
jgi:signal transduction histidine kinase